MGNWRTVSIVGTVPIGQVKSLRDAVLFDYMAEEPNFDNEGPLAFSPKGSLCGLHEWVSPDINAGGNLFERDYSVESVAEHLTKLVKAAPDMDLKVHCGGDYEDEKCIATITVAGGRVSVGAAEVETVDGVDPATSAARMFGFLMRP